MIVIPMVKYKMSNNGKDKQKMKPTFNTEYGPPKLL
jgi:hypothetical protein